MQAPISSSSATATTLGNYQGGDTAARAVHPVLDAINESTKWTVSMAVFATLAVRRDLVCTLWVFGSIVAAIFCKIMKFAINEARPSTARKTDPGMPSSHANSLAFLSTFISLWAANSTSTFFSFSSFFGIVVAPAVAVFLTWLRIALGYHSVPQVVVGYSLGASVAVGWWQVCVELVLPILRARPELQWWLYAMTTAAIVGFTVDNVSRWIAEQREKH